MSSSSTSCARAWPAPATSAAEPSLAASQALADRFMAQWRGLCGDDAALEGTWGWGGAVSRLVGTQRQALESCERQWQARELSRRNPFAGLQPTTLGSTRASLVADLGSLEIDLGSAAEPQAWALAQAYDVVAQVLVREGDANGILRSRLLAAEALAKSKISAQLDADAIARAAGDCAQAHPSLSRLLLELHAELRCDIVASHDARDGAGLPASHVLAKNQAVKADGMSAVAGVDAFESVARVMTHDARGDIVGLGLSTFACGRDIACLGGGGTAHLAPSGQPIDDRGSGSYCLARDPARGGVSCMVTSHDAEQGAHCATVTASLQAVHAARLLATRLPLLLEERDIDRWRGGDREVALGRFRAAASAMLERVHFDANNTTADERVDARVAERYEARAVACIGFRLQPLPDDGALLTAIGLGDGMLISYDARTQCWATIVPAVRRRDHARADGVVSERPDTIGSALKATRVHVDVLSRDDVDHLTYFAFASGFVDGAERLGLVEGTIEASLDGEFRVLQLDPTRMARQAATERDSTLERLAACKRIAIEGVVDALMEDLVACACDEAKVPGDFGADTTGLGGRARALLALAAGD